ncbi:AroM family protein [Brevibacillus humidisoli]|uniref:AroM family protein n=1 Tax=Brevibacillus humidisoli TaxID=2895522 RepID=UPI001E2B9B42|nr:AroM family protein [Brevibacillus humidisoli]UFJ39261.1 AroM family protein [Brevibacillus humidisoli]
MKKLGVATIGQAPRPDAGPILEKHLGGKAELVQVGVLDGMSEAEVNERLAPAKGQYTLTSRLTNGVSVVMAREKIEPILQEKIDGLEKEGCEQILVLCTGVFHNLKTKSAYLIEPDQIITPTVAAMVKGRRFGVIVPLPDQAASLADKWQPHGVEPLYAAASPYEFQRDTLEAAAVSLQQQGAEIILLDCMGYVEEMRQIAGEASGLPVILSNAIMAKIISEML